MSAQPDLAEHYGIVPSYSSIGGEVLVPGDTRLHFLRAMGADADSAAHTRELPEIDSNRPTSKCHFPNWLRNGRVWGIAAQLYEIRSERNWGIGDFADLAIICETAAEAGADFLGLNPLHALFLAEAKRCSPFSPSSRLFLNPLYIAVDRVAGFKPAMIDGEELKRLRDPVFVDYAGVARIKLDVLSKIWRSNSLIDCDALADFRRRGGDALQRHALFESVSEHMMDLGHGSGWTTWPQHYAQPDSPSVQAFARESGDRINFHIWLQWLARTQLAEAAGRAKTAGMRIGLYLDFAVGEAPDGSATWGRPGLAVTGVSIGAPPDVFSANGQDWGLTPLSPAKLAKDGFASYSALMKGGMLDAGALRIDHAMSLQQLFWIPQGSLPADGGFVRYPTTGMLCALAQASQDKGTLVIGEDLGHVPEGFRETMSNANILSYRILYFQRDGQRFIRPRAWPSLSMACLSTHDLPTLAGWWRGSDVELRLKHGLIDANEATRQSRARIFERREMLNAFSRNAVLNRRALRTLADAGRIGAASYELLAIAAHRFIARTNSRLACMRLADAVGEAQPTNLPGTSDRYPNWRRKLDLPLERLPSLPLFRALAAAMQNERPR
jgi:4-alpha-glucanotransferase